MKVGDVVDLHDNKGLEAAVQALMEWGASIGKSLKVKSVQEKVKRTMTIVRGMRKSVHRPQARADLTAYHNQECPLHQQQRLLPKWHHQHLQSLPSTGRRSQKTWLGALPTLNARKMRWLPE
jgi:hypothetical protein